MYRNNSMRNSDREFPQTSRMILKKRITIAVLIAFMTQSFSAHAQATNADPHVYLLSTFKEGEQSGLNFAYNFEGYHWSAAPILFLKAHVDGKIMRDPSISRRTDGTWHLVWTAAWKSNKGCGYAYSKNLVHWCEQKFTPIMEHDMTRPPAVSGHRTSSTTRRKINSSSTGLQRFPAASTIISNRSRTIFVCIS